MAKPISETLIHVLRPDAAFMSVAGLVDIWLINEPLDYTGRIVVQSGIYSSDEDEASGMANLAPLLKYFQGEDGFSVAPEMAILGWVTTGKLIAYQTDEDFQRDSDRHGVDQPLHLLKQLHGAPQIYGLELKDPQMLAIPILEFPGPETYGQYYTPEEPLQELAIKRAFGGQHGIIATTED